MLTALPVEERTLVATAEQLALVKKYDELREAKKRLEGELSALQEQLVNSLGETNRVVREDGSSAVTLSLVQRTSIDRKRLEAELPEVAAAYTQTNWSTRLTVTA
jgi:hypothetical protein